MTLRELSTISASFGAVASSAISGIFSGERLLRAGAVAQVTLVRRKLRLGALRHLFPGEATTLLVASSPRPCATTEAR